MKCLNYDCNAEEIEEDDNFCYKCGHWTAKGYSFLKKPENLQSILNGDGAKKDDRFSIMVALASLAFIAFTFIGFFRGDDLYKPLSQKDNRKLAALMKFYKHVYNIIGVIIFIIGVALIPFLNEIVTGDIPNVKENIKFLYFMYLVNTVVSYFFVYKATLLEADQKKYITSTHRKTRN